MGRVGSGRGWKPNLYSSHLFTVLKVKKGKGVLKYTLEGALALFLSAFRFLLLFYFIFLNKIRRNNFFIKKKRFFQTIFLKTT